MSLPSRRPARTLRATVLRVVVPRVVAFGLGTLVLFLGQAVAIEHAPASSRATSGLESSLNLN